MRQVTISRRFGVGAIDTGQLIAEHYRLVERIGSGGTGVVWRAVDERLQRSVAIKQIHIKPSLPESERDVLRQRAIREARNAARFQHPNAIVVFDITEHGGDPCLVMEYLESRSLAMVLSAQGPMALAQVSRIGEQVAAALIAAHQAGIVHRDVKPGNVLLDDHGTVKITDFGISRATGDVALTETGLICGTAAYLAPEVARGADPSPAADVFSLGATLFHALEGEPPYGSGNNPLAVLYAAANGQVSQPKQAGPATDFLLSLLTPQPGDRPTMREAREQLARFASGQKPLVVSKPPSAPAPALNGAGSTGATRAIQAPAAVLENTIPPRPPAGPHSFPPTAQQRFDFDAPTGKPPRTGRRSAALLGVVVGAVLAASVLLVTVVDYSHENSSAAKAGASTSAAPNTTDAKAPALGTTPNSGTVQYSPAGQLLENFYKSPKSSWSLLTPAAQAVYGDQSAFQEYWSGRVVESFSTIDAYKNTNNPDGSVDMKVHGLTVGNQTRDVVLRVISSQGRLLIDGDTR